MRLLLGLLALVSVGASSCSIPGLELAGKNCPCVDDYVCDERRNVCVRADELLIDSGAGDTPVDARADTAVTDTRADTTLPGGFDCSVHADKKLYCTNRPDAPVRATPKNAGTIVDVMTRSYSFFTCWTTGDLHGGGNTTWYYTQGDRDNDWGYMCANDLNTLSSFDANPSAHGLPRCP